METTALPLPNPDEDPLDGIVIETSSVKDFKIFINLLMTRKPQYATMGAVTGNAGIGKTKAIQAFLNSRKALSHTGISDILTVTLFGTPTQRGVADAIADQMMEHITGKNATDIAINIGDALDRNDIRLVIIDEADLMDEDGFELVRGIFDRTHRPILLVGLPGILDTIKRYEKFDSRVGLRQLFLPPDKTEFFDVILPAMPFDHWVYQKDEAESVSMGEYLYQKVGTSFRKLCYLLATADQIAEARSTPDNPKRIDLETLKLATKWSPTDENYREDADTGSNSSVLPSNENGADPDNNDSPEALSERRNANKTGKGRGKKR